MPSSAAALTSGALDPSFGVNGYASTAFGMWAAAAATVLQPDGYVVTAGQTNVGGTNEFIATRYTPSGQLDNSFGNNGIVTVAIGSYASVDSGAALALQPDGKIVIAGAGVANWHHDFAVARLRHNGTLDQKFGSGGIAAIPVGDAAFANAVVVDPYGNIDVSGTATTGGSNHFFAARLDPAGAPDPSFGNGGVTVLNPTAAAWGMVLQPDGSLVLAGQESHNSTQAFMAARVEADGSLDPTFGDGGFATIPIGSWAAGYAIALQSDGKLVIGGNAKSSSGSNMAAIARLDPDGSLDSSFVSGGILQFAGGGLNAVTIDSSGRIYLAGVGVTAMRLMPSGSVDTSFAHGGFGGYCNGTNCAANGVSIDPTSGNVVLAGITHILGVPEILVLRIFP